VIVLDENLDEQRVRLPLASRYKGGVLSIRDLRPGSVIKDEAIPSILCGHRDCTFITTNVSDFWRRVPAHNRYCVLCVPLPSERQDEIPDLLLRFFRHELFRSARQRMGKVFRVSPSEILYYEVTGRIALKARWV